MDTIIGKTIGRYQITGELGRGGIATVYRGMDSVLGRTVAVKMLINSGEGFQERHLRRFQREAKTLAQLSDPSIVKVLDYGEYEGSPYLVMEYISGGTLSGRMGKPMPYTEAAALLLPIARALHHAHQRKVIHRDVKPANILFNESGQPMLSDFGIVKLTDTDESQGLTGTGSLVGTPSYMSPEQIQGKAIDERTDVYALGIVFFELVTGRKPYVASTPVEVTVKHLSDPVPHPRQFSRDVPQEVEQVIMKAMAKKPENRYQDMAVFAGVLEKLSAGQKSAVKAVSKVVNETVEEKEAGENQKGGKKRLPRAALFAGGAALILLLAGGAYLGGLFGKSPVVEGAGTTQVAEVPTTAAAETLAPSPAPSSTLPAATPTAPPATPTVEAPSPTPTEAITPTRAPVVGAITAENAALVVELSRLGNISVIDMALSHDGKNLLVGGSAAINMIDPSTMKSVGQVNLGADVPKMIRVTSDDRQVAALIGSTVKFFNLGDRKLARAVQFQGGANSMALSHDNALIALGMPNSRVLLVDAQSGAVTRTLRSNPGGWSVAFSPDDRLVAAGTTKGTRVWEVSTGIVQPISTGTNDMFQVVAFSHDGKLLAAAGTNIIRVWEVSTLQEVAAMDKPNGNVKTMAFSPDDRLLVTGSEDAKIRIWDLSSLSDVHTLGNNTSPVFGVLFSEDGRLIFSGANEGNVRLFGIP